MSVERGRAFYLLQADGSLCRVFQEKERGQRISSLLNDPNLVVVIEHDGINKKIKKGPRFRADRFNAAFLMEMKISPSEGEPDLGKLVPDSVRHAISRWIGTKSVEFNRSLQSHWHNVSKENDLVSLLIPFFHTSMSLDGWSVEIRPQIFSDQIKEPRLGADLGWVIQIKVGGKRYTTKAVWMQAKRTVYDVRTVKALFDLKDFRAQFGIMRSFTESSFGIVFSPEAVVVGDDKRITTMEALFDEIIGCSVGDQRETTLVQSADRAFVSIDISCKSLKATVARARERRVK